MRTENEGRAVWAPEGDRIVFQAACFDFSDPACFYFDLFTIDRKGGSIANITSTPDTGEAALTGRLAHLTEVATRAGISSRLVRIQRSRASGR